MWKERYCILAAKLREYIPTKDIAKIIDIDKMNGTNLREKDCLKRLYFNFFRGIFVPDRPHCKNNCAFESCKWFKR